MNRFEEYCMSLPSKTKVRLISMLRDSLEVRDSGKTFGMLHDAIVKVVGHEVVSKSRKRELVIGRTILAHACALEGWSEHAIGNLLQRDHSTINILKKEMREWLNAPNLFKAENDLYIKFLKELSHETDR